MQVLRAKASLKLPPALNTDLWLNDVGSWHFFFFVCVCAKSSTFGLRDDAFQPEKQRPEFSLIMKEGSRFFWFVTHLLKCVTKQIFVTEKPSSGRVNKICI